jgi:hypothetical protein
MIQNFLQGHISKIHPFATILSVDIKLKKIAQIPKKIRFIKCKFPEDLCLGKSPLCYLQH